MSEINQFHIRHASSAGDDAQFIVAAFDSTILYLTSIGAGAMWGEKPFSEKEGFEQETVESVQKSESHEDSVRIFIAKVKSPGAANAHPGATPANTEQSAKQSVRVGAAMIREDSLPTYITERQEMKPEVDRAKHFLFMKLTGSLHKGARSALIEAIKRYGRENNKNTLYVDCWAGNSGKLNKYYEKYGFIKVGDFSFGRARET
ncbi:hypothetical protein TOPH_02919 [Tolypocladium ophioglossoides CBS 100239]|uniref:N-acetyltransferase domain-containing protein n=1 Tax=Tolypocladium ophioglossoides (strain CBS 100239) TaxID=1163406 RepID=A0A0L0NE13_TOLOC|nr:hypothetical protein TOPH_02919 [Tolypocladium ophioglossoides CBS 100239]